MAVDLLLAGILGILSASSQQFGLVADDRARTERLELVVFGTFWGGTAVGTSVFVRRWSVRQRWVAAGIAAALVAGMAVAVVRLSATDVIAVDCGSAALPSVAEASALASACGGEVEITGERTPWATVYAQPAGTTRMSLSAVAQRTNVNGPWEDIDVTVTPAGEGGGSSGWYHGSAVPEVFADEVDESVKPDVSRMSPVAAPVNPMWFNPGGDSGVGLPLGVVQKDESWVALRFPMALPEPEVNGRFITYPLADGVRLQIAVMTDGSGFRPIVELDSPEAARWFQGALSSLREQADLPGTGYEIPYRVYSSEGLTLRALGERGFEVVDGDDPVFWSPQSLMWDSAADESETGPVEREEFPLPGDRAYDMPVRLAGAVGGSGAVVVSPDEQMLAAEDTVWPVRIDPTLGARTPTEWIAIRTGGYTSSIYKWSDSTRVGESMGHCSLSWSPYCVVTFTSRLVWEFGDSTLVNWMKTLKGADIVSAEFTADPGERGGCTSSRTDVYRTSSIAGSTSTWSNLSFSTYLSNVTGPQGDACSDGGARRGWDVTAGVRSVADANGAAVTLGLKANSESSSSGYKTYKANATLNIVYNRPPNIPSGLKLASPVAGCVSGSSRPEIASTTPTMTAVVSDPDGGSVRAQFRITQLGTERWNSGTLAAKSSGSSFSAKVTSGILANGTAYRYEARGYDGSKWSSWSTTRCEFKVDLSKPVAPTVTAVRTGVAAVYDEDVERGGVGLQGKFTLSSGASTDVVSFSYSFNSTTLSSSVAPNSAGQAVVAYTPTSTGPVTLRVLSIDDAGNRSATTSYVFDVGAPKEDAIWALDEESGSTAADTSGVGADHDLTLHGTTRVDGPHELFGSRADDRALQFDGGSDQASTGPIVNTKKSFVISAFVWLDAAKVKTGTFTAVSQDGVTQSGFDLSYLPSCTGTTTGCWSFGMKNTDAASATTTVARSTAEVSGDRWVHLVGAHDATAKTVQLWACEIGTPAAPAIGEPVKSSTARSATPWSAAGAFTLGRGLTNGTPSNWWPGRVDNVRVFSGQVISSQKILRMCQGAEATDFATGRDALDPTTKNGE